MKYLTIVLICSSALLVISMFPSEKPMKKDPSARKVFYAHVQGKDTPVNPNTKVTLCTSVMKMLLCYEDKGNM